MQKLSVDLSIGEVARRAGIRASAIRYYERVGVLPPARLVNTKRRYTPDIFPQLLLISYAQESGLTIAEIRVVLNPEQEANLVGGWQALARQKLLAMEQRMRHLERMKQVLEAALQDEHLTVEGAIRLFQQSVDPE